MTVVRPRGDEVGEAQLVQDARPRLPFALGSEHAVHVPLRQHHPAEPHRGGQALADRADVDHALGVETLDGADGLAVVAELPVVVVLQDHPAPRACPVDHRCPALGGQRSAGRELVRGREQHGPFACQPVDTGAVFVEGERHGPYAGSREQFPVEGQPVRLHGQWSAQDPVPAVEEQPQRVREARADHDPLRLRSHTTRACQILRERLPELDATGGITGPEHLVGRLLQSSPVGGQPGRTRERGRVRGALAQVVPGATRGCTRLGPTRACRCVPERARTVAERFGTGRHPGARALAGGQPALRDQLRVRVGDSVAGDTEVGGERAVRRQPGAGGEPPAARGLAQRLDERGPPPTRRSAQDAGRPRSAPLN